MKATVSALLATVAALSAAEWTTAARDQLTIGAEAPRAVEIQVSVRDGSRAVSGLTAADFVVADNEVTQTVEAVILDLPTDVTLVIDTKGSNTNIADRLAKDLQQIARLLRKDDALRVLRLDTFVEELRPMTPVTGQVTTTGPWRAAGLSSLHDALIAGLVRPGVPGRRQLLICMTDGIDTMSVTTADRVREVASRSDTVMQIVTVRPAISSGVVTALRPHSFDRSALILTEAAENTGGELRAPTLFGDGDLVSAFTRALDEFRQRYVLRYTPTNVEHAGWHELSVTVPRSPNAVVRARRGYHAR